MHRPRTRRWECLTVESVGDGPQALPFEKHPEESSHNLGFLLVNYDPPTDRALGRPISISGSAGGESAFGAPEHSVVRECTQPVEILGVHHAADLCSEI